MNLLLSLLDLVSSGVLLSLDEARRIHRRMMWFPAYPVGLVLMGFCLNLFGILGVNIIMVIVLAGAALVVWIEPGVVLMVSGATAAIAIADETKRSHVVEEVRKIFLTDGWYISVLKNVLVGSAFLFYVLGTLSFRTNPMAFFGILGAVIVMGALIWKWPAVFAGHKGKKIAFGYAAITATFWVLSLASGPTWVKYTGWDPLTAKTTSTEESLYKLNRAQREMADASRAKELERITDNVRSGKALTNADLLIIAEAQQAQTKKDADHTARDSSATCRDLSVETRECWVTAEWSNLFKNAGDGSLSGDEMHGCASQGVESERIMQAGTAFFRFRVKDGKRLVRYKLLPVGETCPLTL